MTQGPPVDPSWAPPTRADDGATHGDTQPVPRHQDTQPLAAAAPASGWDQPPTPLHGALPAPAPAGTRGPGTPRPGRRPLPRSRSPAPPTPRPRQVAVAASAPSPRSGWCSAACSSASWAACSATGWPTGSASRTPADIPVAQGPGPGRPSDSVAGVAAKVLPSTVSIEVSSASAEGSGSGFVLREDGMILTNNHVVAEAADGGRIVVVFSDGSQADATVVGRTGDYDLAVLKVERTGLTPLPFGDSDDVVVGDPVIAVGAPLGLESTVTTGIVSALNRPVSAGPAEESSFINAIQTDAAINPGNSGGPLVNMAGEVIGINSAIARNPSSDAAGNIGLGFAIPSKQAARTAEQLIDTGRATYPIIGVLLDRSYTGEGVKVTADDRRPGRRHPGRPRRPGGHPARRRHHRVQRPTGHRAGRADRRHPRPGAGRHRQADGAQRRGRRARGRGHPRRGGVELVPGTS